MLRHSGAGREGLFDTNVGSVGLLADLSKGLRSRDAGQHETLDVALQKEQIAGVIPRLSGLHDDLDLVELVQPDRFVLFRRHAALDDDPLIGDAIAGRHEGADSLEVQDQSASGMVSRQNRLLSVKM